MLVRDLIADLQKLPQDEEVHFDSIHKVYIRLTPAKKETEIVLEDKE